jgi:hypothetical protein
MKNDLFCQATDYTCASIMIVNELRCLYGCAEFVLFYEFGDLRSAWPPVVFAVRHAEYFFADAGTA